MTSKQSAKAQKEAPRHIRHAGWRRVRGGLWSLPAFVLPSIVYLLLSQRNAVVAVTKARGKAVPPLSRSKSFGIRLDPRRYPKHPIHRLPRVNPALLTAKFPRGGAALDSEYSSHNENSYNNYYNNGPAPPPGQGSSTENQNDDPYDEEEDYYYDDRGTATDVTASATSFVNSLPLPAVFRKGDRKLGITLLGSGLVVTLLGIMTFFNRFLMRIGNILLIAGVPIFMGINQAVSYFVQPHKLRATACLAGGIFLVVVAGWPMFGLALEIFGLLNLFGNMFPLLTMLAKSTPGLGPMLQNLSGGNSNGGSRQGSGSRPNEDDDYYYDRDYQDDRNQGSSDRGSYY
jgi:Got1/Sft2-like family